MATGDQTNNLPNHLRPWSTVDDEELALLRQLEHDVIWGAGDDPVLMRTVGQLRELRQRLAK